MRYFFLLLCIACVPWRGFGQTQDSLIADGMLMRLKGMMNTDASKGLATLDSLKDFLDAHPQLKAQKAEWLKFKGIFSFRMVEYDSALHYYARAYFMYDKTGNKLEAAKVMVNTSMVYNRLSVWDSTIMYARAALKSFEELDDKKGIGIATNIIGQVFFSNEDYDKALVYFRQYLANAIATNDSMEMGGGYNNVGSCLADMKNYDSTEYYGLKALEISLKVGNRYGIANAKQNLATNYERIGEYEKCIPLYEDALKAFHDLGNKAGILETSLNLGWLYNRREQPRLALPILEEALEISRELGETRHEVTALGDLASVASNLGDYKRAYEYMLDYHALKDTLFSMDSRKVIEEVNTKYETEKKDRQIADFNYKQALDAATIQRSRVQILWLVVAVILLVLGVVVWQLIHRNRQAAKAIAQERMLRETRMRSVIEGQENERKRFAADLHDNIGQLISALQLNLHNLRKRQMTEEVVPLFDNSGKLLGTLQSEIRNTINGLMPPILSREGLVPALREMAARVSGAGGVQVEFGAYGLDRRFVEQAEIALYRVSQEWTSNVVKYAHASHLTIQVVAHEDEVVLTFEDDGQGFAPENLMKGKGNGWTNIRTRLELVGGKLELDTAAGRQGSTLILTVPCTQLRELTLNSLMAS